MWLLFCWPAPNDPEKNLVSSVEAVEEINKRSRHISTIVAQLESQIRKEKKETTRYAKNKDEERARLGIQRLKLLGQKKTRLLNCTQKLWAMRETLKEQAVYVNLTEVFATTNTTLEQLLKKVDLDQITQMMDTFEEQAHQTREVSRAMASSNVSYTLEEEIEEEIRQMANVKDVREENPLVLIAEGEKKTKSKIPALAQ